jgi:hypothetical protein
MQRVSLKPCEHCGKELLWGAARWPIETAPRPLASYPARAFAFRPGPNGYVAVDVRDLHDPPELVYPQHKCPVWQEMRERDASRDRRLNAVMTRLTRDAS